MSTFKKQVSKEKLLSESPSREKYEESKESCQIPRKKPAQSRKSEWSVISHIVETQKSQFGDSEVTGINSEEFHQHNEVYSELQEQGDCKEIAIALDPCS